MTAQESEDFVETLEDMQFTLIQDLKDAGVPRQLWESISEAADGFETAEALAEYRARMISIHGF